MNVKSRARKWQLLIVLHTLPLFAALEVVTLGYAGPHKTKLSEFEGVAQ